MVFASLAQPGWGDSLAQLTIAADVPSLQASGLHPLLLQCGFCAPGKGRQQGHDCGAMPEEEINIELWFKKKWKTQFFAFLSIPRSLSPIIEPPTTQSCSTPGMGLQSRRDMQPEYRLQPWQAFKVSSTPKSLHSKSVTNYFLFYELLMRWEAQGPIKDRTTCVIQSESQATGLPPLTKRTRGSEHYWFCVCVCV